MVGSHADDVVLTRARASSVQLLMAAALTALLACTPFKDRRSTSKDDDTAAQDAAVDPEDAGMSTSTEPPREVSKPGDAAGAGGRGEPKAGSAGRSEPAANTAGEPARAGSSGGNPSNGSTGLAGSAAGASAGSGGEAARDAGDAPVDDPPPSTEPLEPDQRWLAVETADAEALAWLADWSKLPVFGTGLYREQSSRDRGGDTPYPFGTPRGNRDFNNFICKTADAEIGSGGRAGFLFDTPTCPETYLRGALLARFEGSGRMVRLWITSDGVYEKSAFNRELLRIYVDDNPRAVVQVPLQDVLTGAAGEIFTIPFGPAAKNVIAWHYPIVFSRKIAVVLDRLSGQYYYQVDAVLDAQAKRRVAPRERLARDAAHALLAAGSPVPAAAEPLHSAQLTLSAGQKQTVELAGPATIEELRVRVAKRSLANLAGARIAVVWDGAARAAIDVPLLALFASAQVTVPNASLALAGASEGDDQTLSLRLPMPFRTSASWTIQGGSNAVDLQLELRGQKRVPAEEFGHLTVQHNVAPLPITQLEQPLAQADGRGRFVGVCADLGGHADRALGGYSDNLEVLQGDFRMLADGQQAVDSTGSDDYADNSFHYPAAAAATAFAQHWGKVDDSLAKPPGQISFCRWQILGNEIDYQTSFKAIHEVAAADPSVVERHATLAFLYVP